MLLSFTDDLYDCISNFIKSNDLYKLLLVHKTIRQNIKKNPIELKKKELENELLHFNPYGKLAQIQLNLEFCKKHHVPLNCSYVFEEIYSKFYDVNYHKIIVIHDLYTNLKIDIKDLCNILVLLDINLRDKNLKVQNTILKEISTYSIMNINKNLIIILNQIYKIITKY